MPNEKTTWIVTTSGDRPVKAVARDLAKAGLRVSQVLEEIGSVIGTGSPGLAPKLRAVPGVVDVSPETAIDIGPPDSTDVW